VAKMYYMAKRMAPSITVEEIMCLDRDKKAKEDPWPF